MKCSNKTILLPPNLSVNSICWIKIKGYKDWPGVIEDEDNGIFKIHFFGDYTYGYVTRSKITNFYEGFGIFSHTFEARGLKKAIQEACICLMNNPNPDHCFVCAILARALRS